MVQNDRKCGFISNFWENYSKLNVIYLNYLYHVKAVSHFNMFLNLPSKVIFLDTYYQEVDIMYMLIVS